MALDPRVALARKAAALDIMDARAPEPDSGAIHPALERVAGDDLALVLHGGGERQRLAAGAGAEIDDALAGPRIGEQRHDLRAFVLHLDEPVLEGGERRERRPAGNAEAERRERRRPRLDPFPLEGGLRPVAIGLQEIDAEIGLGRHHQRRHFRLEALAIELAQGGFEPFGEFEPHPVGLRRVGQRLAGERAGERPLLALQRRRAIGPAVEAAGDAVGRPAFEQGERGDHPFPLRAFPALAGDPPIEARAGAQDRIDALEHVAPVAAADIAAMPEIIRNRAVGWRGAAMDGGQQLDRGLEPRAGRHGRSPATGRTGVRQRGDMAER